MPEITTLNIDEIAVISERLPVGRGYIAKLAAAEGKQSKAGKDMVEATWEIVKGDFQGFDAKTFHSLTWSVGKNNKTYAPGIMEMKRLFAAIGKPLPAAFNFPTTAGPAAQLFGKKLQGLQVELMVVSEKARDGSVNDDGTPKEYTRVKVVGLATPLIKHDSGGSISGIVDEFDS